MGSTIQNSNVPYTPLIEFYLKIVILKNLAFPQIEFYRKNKQFKRVVKCVPHVE